MNATSLALAFTFAAIAVAFLAQARKESDPVNARNKRLVSIFFLIAAAGFGASFVLSLVGD